MQMIVKGVTSGKFKKTSAIEVPFYSFQQQKANPRSMQCFQSTTGMLLGKPELLIPAPVCGDASQPLWFREDLEPGAATREPSRVPLHRETRVSRGLLPKAAGARRLRRPRPRGAATQSGT